MRLQAIKRAQAHRRAALTDARRPGRIAELVETYPDLWKQFLEQVALVYRTARRSGASTPPASAAEVRKLPKHTEDMTRVLEAIDYDLGLVLLGQP